jgi:hypothetical protein
MNDLEKEAVNWIHQKLGNRWDSFAQKHGEIKVITFTDHPPCWTIQKHLRILTGRNHLYVQRKHRVIYLVYIYW